MKTRSYLACFLIVLLCIGSLTFSFAYAKSGKLTSTFNKASFNTYKSDYFKQRNNFRQQKFDHYKTVRNQRINTRQIQKKKIDTRRQQITVKREQITKQRHARIEKRNTAIAKREKEASKRKEIVKQNKTNREIRETQNKRRLEWLKDRQARKVLADKQKKKAGSALTVSALMRSFGKAASVNKASAQPISQVKSLKGFKDYRGGQAELQKTSKELDYQRKSIKERFNRLAQQRAVTNSDKLKNDKKKELSKKQKLAQTNFNSIKTLSEGGNKRLKLKPDPEAQGSHSTYKINKQTGKITGHAEWKQNPQNPSGFDQVKRVDTQYAKPHTHTNKVTKEIVPTPHVHDKSIPGKIRAAAPEELPK